MHYYQKPAQDILNQADQDIKTPLGYYNIETMDLILGNTTLKNIEVEALYPIDVEYSEISVELKKQPSEEAIRTRRRLRYKHKEEDVLRQLAMEKRKKIIMAPINIKTQNLPPHWAGIVIDTEKKIAYVVNTYPGYGRGVMLGLAKLIKDFVYEINKIIAFAPQNDNLKDQNISNIRVEHQQIHQQRDLNDCGPLIASLFNSIGNLNNVTPDTMTQAVDNTMSKEVSNIRVEHTTIITQVSVQIGCQPGM